MASPLLINRSGNSRLNKYEHWNRRVWQEIAIIKSRLDAIEDEVKVDTGGDYEFAPEGDPWEKETVYERVGARMVIGGFLLGIVVGIALTVAVIGG